jgi:hypothetical protein
MSLEEVYNKLISEYSNDGKTIEIALPKLVEILKGITDLKTDTPRLKRPQSGYFLWLNANRASIKDEYFSDYKLQPGEKMIALVTKKAGRIWKELDAEDKEPYLEKAKILKSEWLEAKDKMGNSEIKVPKVKGKRGRPKKKKSNVIEVSKILINDEKYLHDTENNLVYNLDGTKLGSLENGIIV